MKPKNELIIKRPDDWHLHLRDRHTMRAVLPFTAELYGRAIIMPNLRPPLRTVQDLEAYRQRILDCPTPRPLFSAADDPVLNR